MISWLARGFGFCSGSGSTSFTSSLHDLLTRQKMQPTIMPPSTTEDTDTTMMKVVPSSPRMPSPPPPLVLPAVAAVVLLPAVAGDVVAGDVVASTETLQMKVRYFLRVLDPL